MKPPIHMSGSRLQAEATTRLRFRATRGFALVATILLMILLTIIALASLSLSAVTQRSTSHTSAQNQARANARMALVIAIGELQHLAGQDTRVTAGSDLISASNVRATGVWRSWEGSDRNATGKPIAPNYALKNLTGNPDNPLAATANEGRFLGWLASPMTDIAPDVNSLTGLSSAATSNSIPLVSSGSVMDPSQEVHAVPTKVDNGDGNGGYAWWISGDNSKAMLNVDPVAKPDTTVAWHARQKSNGRADPEIFGMGDLDDLPNTRAIPSTATLELIGASQDIRKFHDLTAFNRGLLTNTATGGWRKDLSLLSENYAALPKLALPSLTRTPGVIQTFSKAKDDIIAPWTHPPNALLYPWANYSNNTANTNPWRQVPPINSWSALTNFMLQYKSLTSASSTKTTMPYWASDFDLYQSRVGYQEQIRRSPVIARIQWIFSLCSRVRADPLDPTNTHQASLLVTPVVTLWNPYNVELSLPNGFGLTYDHIAPLSFRFRVGGTLYPDTTLYEITGSSAAGYLQYFHIKIPSAITLAPGASRIFGLNNNIPVENAVAGSGSNINLTPGYRPNGGFMFYRLNKGAEVYGKSTDTFAVEEFAFNGQTTQNTGSGLGMYMELWVNRAGGAGNKTDYSGHRMVYNKAVLGGDAVINALYPTVSNTISSTLGEVVKENNKPFVGAIFGFKPATPRPREAKFNSLHTKGMLNNHPLTFYSEVGSKALANNAGMTGTGAYHPANAPYEFSFQDVNGWNDTQAIPQFELSSNSGYIVSGLTAGDGLTRCVMAELPTRPLQSLAELQHFDARKNNPIPPFQFNLIGNGSANPIFAPDQIRVESTFKNNQFFCNDDTFILNHLLFDDWFVSSIAPELNDFSRTEKRTMTQVYQDHLDSKTPLPNRFYHPAPGADPDFSVVSSTKDSVTQMFAYETIASQLEVAGMINVNSVSVDAWKSWLRQGRDAKTPYLTANGSTELDATRSFAFPRTSIAGDSSTDSGSNASNPLFPDAVEFSGYRALTDSQIDALAEEIVSEIRKRGPFLSLSEFVNRRLTTDKSLAAAGTIQQALDTLAKSSDSSKNPYTKIQNSAVEITTQQPGPTDYKFPEAALGSSAFGVPGWIRQADILTPLAPMISVRDDTFTIRAYGDARDKNDPSKIIAQAWCEVTVCRRPDYSDSTDPRQITPHSTSMNSEANKRYGRRFEIVSFRWLHSDEI